MGAMTKTRKTTRIDELLAAAQEFEDRKTAFFAKQEAARATFLRNLQNEHNVLYAKTKIELGKFVKDKRISLAERWERFGQAPLELKGASQYLPRNMSSALRSFVDELSVDINKGDLVDVCATINDYGCLDDYLEDKNAVVFWGAFRVDELLEEILQANLGSFSYDW